MRFSSSTSPRFRVRRPEYTGPNRCLPCTAVNLVLVAAATAVVAAVSLPAALAVGTVSLALVYLRGYLVPGTPALTKRYLPERMFAWFGKADGPTSDVDPGVVLAAADVLVEEPGGADVALDPQFVVAWTERTRALLEEDAVAVLAAEAGTPGADLTVRPAGEGLVATVHGRQVASWESAVALRADAAAMGLLAERVPAWDHMAVDAHSETTGALRLLADTCPSCGSPTALEEGTVESCCASYPVVAVRCSGCHARLVEMRLTEEMLATDAEPDPDPLG
ncbi:MAG: hypothetical protein V5A30_02895 [Haloarculaceae archaeon]